MTQIIAHNNNGAPGQRVRPGTMGNEITAEVNPPTNGEPLCRLYVPPQPSAMAVSDT